jgi:hypothetical protein
MAHAGPHRPQSGLTLPGWHRAALATVSHSGIDLIMQDATHAGGIPPRLAHRGRERGVAQSFGDSIKGARRLRLRVPGKDLSDHGRFDGIESQTTGVPGTFGIEQIAIGGDSPG